MMEETDLERRFAGDERCGFGGVEVQQPCCEGLDGALGLEAAKSVRLRISSSRKPFGGLMAASRLLLPVESMIWRCGGGGS
jgi:hypothetical protein